MTPEEFAEKLKNGEFGYKGERTIKLISCNTGYGENSFAEKLSKLMPGVTIIAPNAFVVVNSRKWWHAIADTQLLLESENGAVTGQEKWLKFKK